MKTTQTLFLGATCALTALVAASFGQETGVSAATEPLQPVPLFEPAQDAPVAEAPLRPFIDQEQPFDEAQDTEFELRERLSLGDLDAREAAFDDVSRQAARSPDVRRALQAISNDMTDLELAFTARLALREADRLASWGRASAGFGRQALPSRPAAPGEALRQRLEALFGSDPFVDEFFSNDPFFTRPFGGRSGVFGVDPFAGSDPFEDMRRRVEEMRQQMDDLRPVPGRPGSGTPAPGGARSSSSFGSSSISIESTPDGVRVEIVEDDGTGPKREIYEADSMDALLRMNPELKGKIGR